MQFKSAKKKKNENQNPNLVEKSHLTLFVFEFDLFSSEHGVVLPFGSCTPGVSVCVCVFSPGFSCLRLRVTPRQGCSRHEERNI